VHPRQFTRLAFSLFSTINEFYQFTHGRLYNFQKTQTYLDLKDKKIFAQCNFFNADSKVARPIETQILAALTRYFNPKTVFEIGTYNGFSAFHFAYNSSPETKIYTLDLPPDYNFTKPHREKLGRYSYDDLLVVQLSKETKDKRIYRGHPGEKKIVELFGDSMYFDFSPYYGKIDFVFIDGCHAYSYVRSDTENAFKMLSPTGVILWHDFDYIVHRDVFKFLNRLVEERKIYSIPHTRFAIYGKNF
jgi:predicted O-methyltransferase YrrM